MHISDHFFALLFLQSIFFTLCNAIELRGPFGQFSSPNYPQQYPPSMDRVWTIRVGSDQRVMLWFQSRFSMEASGTCAYDYVEIHDGTADDSRVIGRYCGTSPPTSALFSAGNIMLIKFHSDSSGEHAGFSATYAGVPKPSECSEQQLQEQQQANAQLRQQLERQQQLHEHQLVLEMRSNASDANFVQAGRLYSVECFAFTVLNPVPSIAWRWKACLASETCAWTSDLSTFASSEKRWDRLRTSSFTYRARETATFECSAAGKAASITMVATDVPQAPKNRGFAVREVNKKAYYCEGDNLVLECLTQKHLYKNVSWSRDDKTNHGDNALNDVNGFEIFENRSHKLSNKLTLTIRNVTARLHEGVYWCTARLNETSIEKREVRLGRIPGELADRTCKSPIYVISHSADDDVISSIDTEEDESLVITANAEAVSAIGEKTAIAALVLAGILFLSLVIVVACFVRMLRRNSSHGAVSYYAHQPLLDRRTTTRAADDESGYDEIRLPADVMKQCRP